MLSRSHLFASLRHIPGGAIPHLYIAERNNSTPVQRQLSLTRAGLKEYIFVGSELMSAMN